MRLIPSFFRPDPSPCRSAQEAERARALRGFLRGLPRTGRAGGRADGRGADAAAPDLTALNAAGEFPVLRVARQIDGRDRLLAHGGEMPLFGPGSKGTGRMWRCRDPAASP
jgi:hypothetical protein